MDAWRIVSGGQTGVDRAALDAARELGLPFGGFIPRGRWTEEGPLPADYEGMIETRARNPAARTRRNIHAADATLVITRGDPDGGTRLTLQTAERLGRPLLHVDLAAASRGHACARIRAWLAGMTPGILNVAGPRASKAPGIYAEAKTLLMSALTAGCQTE